VSFIKSRLRRMESVIRSVRCPECSLSSDSPGRIVFSDEDLPNNVEETCPGCGMRLWFVIEIVGEGA